MQTVIALASTKPIKNVMPTKLLQNHGHEQNSVKARKLTHFGEQHKKENDREVLVQLYNSKDWAKG